MTGETTKLPDPTKAGLGWAPHLFLLLLVATCGAVVVWSHFGTLDVVAVARGEVTPSSQVKQVQHFEGGVLKEILVREGDDVTAGQPLAVLESAASDADVGELTVRLAGLSAEMMRLDAELSGNEELAFPGSFSAEYPDLVQKQMDLFRSRRQNLGDKLNASRQAIRQRELEVKEVRTRISNNSERLKLIEKQVKISEGLLADKLSSEFQHLDLLRQAQELRGQIAQDRATAEKAKAAQAQANAGMDAVQSGYEAEARQARTEAQRNHNELTQRLGKFADSQSRTTLRSPVDGVIKSLYRVTQGGVLKPGDVFADVVPLGDRLVVEAALSTGDIGYVQRGQLAKIRLASADANRFGSIEGAVETISPDTLITEDGLPYYKVRILTDKDRFTRGDQAYALYPGMTVDVSILTGTRTVLDYLLDPFLGFSDRALRER